MKQTSMNILGLKLAAVLLSAALLPACSKQDSESTESRFDTPHTDNPAPAEHGSMPSAEPEPSPADPVNPNAQSAPADAGGYQSPGDKRDAPAAEGAASPEPTAPATSAQ